MEENFYRHFDGVPFGKVVWWQSKHRQILSCIQQLGGWSACNLVSVALSRTNAPLFDVNVGRLLFGFFFWLSPRSFKWIRRISLTWSEGSRLFSSSILKSKELRKFALLSKGPFPIRMQSYLGLLCISCVFTENLVNYPRFRISSKISFVSRNHIIYVDSVRSANFQWPMFSRIIFDTLVNR